MARRSQCSSAGDNPLDPNYLPPHYREEYRLAIDALIEEDLEGYYQFLQKADVVDFLALPEIEYIQSLIQAPQLSNSPEQQHPETGGDGSSDTYWPIHSDLDAPGLDLGWPQMHHFMGPTEVTTLVNPPEPNMPSIKDQARRLIKNAQQVIAIVMDMFTDVDMFADILSAAMRNVAVYILLDEQNAHHFINMVSNCRVNLQGIQLLRVRTVSGITYHCRTGKSLKGQMMDRFLLTDCRAVLSGNYSFMWSFEKLHRCMAHLFLGQLVSTFDEEFRILFAQSQPLVIDYNPREEVNLSQKRQYPGERTMYREPKKFQSMDTAHPEQWQRQPYDEPMDVDWRMVPLKKQDSLHGPAEMYGRFTPQLSRMDPPFDQGPPRMPMMENPAFKRHSYAEGGHGRYSSPFLQQQRVPEPENQGRQFYRGQQPYPGPGPAPGKEADYSAYDKFWNQDFHPADQYSEPGLEQEIDVPDNFDPVRNYLASTRNPDFDQDVDLSFGSPHLRRLSSGQLQASQTSPIPSNPTDEKQYLQVPNTDRKDPKVKRGLRNWRISSYLSAYDNPGDEGLPSAPPNESDPFEDLSNPIQQIPAIEISVHKIPNVREFKVPAIPRASQLPSYAKTAAQEQPKKLPDELTVVVAETKTTPTPSESSSSTTEVEKFEDAELKEPKPSGLRREDSFRRKYNAAMPRSSRLRSSLIFSSMDQQQPSQDPKTDPEQKEEESGKNEAEQTKLPFASQFLGQRRVTGREPFEWSRYMKSATFDNSATDPSKPDGGTSKPDDKDSPKNENPKGLSEVPKSLKPPDVEQAISSPSMPQSKASEAELPKTDQPVQPPEPLLTTPLFLDMNDPDNRLMFFKELAAKRKAAKAAEAEKSKDKAPVKPTTELKSNTTVKKEEPVPKESSEKMADTSTSEGSSETKATAEDKTNKKDSQVKTDPNTTQSCKQEQTKVSTDSENNELKNSQSSATLPVSAKTEAPQSKTPEELKLPNPAVKTSSPSHPPTDPPTVKREEPVPNESSENMVDPSTSEGLLGTNATTEDARKTVSTEACSDKTNKQVESGQDSKIKTDPKTSQSCKQDQTKGSTDSKKTELKNSQSATPQSKPPEELKQSIPAVKGSSPSHPSRPTDQSTPVPKESSEKMADPSTSEGLLGTNATTKYARKTVSTEASKSASLSSVASDKTNKQVKSGQDSQVKTDPQTSQSYKQDQSKVSTDSKTTPPTTANATPTSVPSLTQGTDGGESPCLDSTSKEKVPPTPALDSNTLNPESVQLETSVSPEQHKGSESSSSKPSVQSSSSDQILPDSGSQISPSPAPTPTETIPCSVTPSDSSSAPTSSTLSPNAQESVSSSPPEPSQLASSKTLSAADTCAAGSEPNTSSLQSASETDPKESCATTPSEKDVPESENKSVSKGVGDESEVSGSSKEVKADSTPSSLSPSLPESPLPNVSYLESKSRSDISPDTCAAGSEPNVSSLQSTKETDPKEPCVPTPLEKDVPESENKSVPKGVGEKSQVSGSSKDVKAESTPLPNGSDLETKSRSAQNETTTPSPTDTPPKHSPAEISSSVNPDLTPNASQSERQVIPPSELNLTGSGTPAETVPSSPPLTESNRESTTEPTSNDPTEPDLQCGTPESVTSETHPTEPSVPAEKSNVDSQSEVSKEPKPEANDTKATNEVNKTTQESVEKANDQVTQNNCSEPPGEVVPPSTQSKQPKSGQSRYQTSTANVLSSSNLRDDTKLLLGQISANSQSRNEAAKESPVTDDEKEDKADKKAIQEKERGIRSHTRGQPKTGPEREKVLEKIQSMRKERRVYSRFEMAP